ncbi:hypothetical protein DPMN_190287 [Dreissena polymorpha]|uniref:Cadherin domain-containing protein n=2 Tax=Dreissena polymorpha TaxID=45954 RepID=A0A9D4IBU0_DREPO|nr:hypothetical protein DPMN_190287 [Dreissena polymorpha]
MQISAAGVVTLAAGKSLDFETTPSYTLVITATGASGSPGVANLTVNIKNVLEFGKTQYDVCMADGSTADTTVGTYTVKDNTGGATVTYAITSGNTNSDFTFTAAGELKVSTGKTLAQKTTEQYTVVLAATESGSPAVADLGSTTVSITVGTCGCSAVAATLGLTLLAVVVAVSA